MTVDEADVEDDNEVTQTDSSIVTPSTVVDRPVDIKLPHASNYNLRSKALVSTVHTPQVHCLDANEINYPVESLTHAVSYVPDLLSEPELYSALELGVNIGRMCN